MDREAKILDSDCNAGNTEGLGSGGHELEHKLDTAKGAFAKVLGYSYLKQTKKVKNSRNSYYNKKIHLKKHQHSSVQYFCFYCKICDFTHYKKIHLKTHKQTAHKRTAVNITWIECDFKTKNPYYLRNHQRDKHAGHKPSKQGSLDISNDLLGLDDTITFLKILFSHFSSQYFYMTSKTGLKPNWKSENKFTRQTGSFRVLKEAHGCTVLAYWLADYLDAEL